MTPTHTTINSGCCISGVSSPADIFPVCSQFFRWIPGRNASRAAAEMLDPPPKCCSRSTVCGPAQRDAGKIDNMRAGSTAVGEPDLHLVDLMSRGLLRKPRCNAAFLRPYSITRITVFHCKLEHFVFKICLFSLHKY